MLDIVIGDEAENSGGAADNPGASGSHGCLRCAYFRVTMDRAYPRACDFFEFKGPQMPSEMVKNATGQECIAFTPNKKYRER